MRLGSVGSYLYETDDGMLLRKSKVSNYNEEQMSRKL